MMTVDQCMRLAWDALLEGDLKKRDFYCNMASNLMAVEQRCAEEGVCEEAIIGNNTPICLPDRSHERIN